MEHKFDYGCFDDYYSDEIVYDVGDLTNLFHSCPPKVFCNLCGLKMLPFYNTNPNDTTSLLTTQIPIGSPFSNPLSTMNDVFIGSDQDIDPDINLINLMSTNSSNYFLEDDFNIMVSNQNLKSFI